MRTVHEVSEIVGISVRTLHHYDKVGLLEPSGRSAAGYRLYDDADLERLQQILLFRELEFPLAEIRDILASPQFDRNRALGQQIDLLKLRRERIDNLIELATSMKEGGMKGSATKEEGMQQEKDARRKTKGAAKGRKAASPSFEAFDKSKLNEYAARAKASWGETPQWDEYERKRSKRTERQEEEVGQNLMALFKPFGVMVAEGANPSSEQAQKQAAAIQSFITQHYYECSNEVFAQLGRMYGAGGEFTCNIDAAAGEGAAAFAAQAIEAYCAR